MWTSLSFEVRAKVCVVYIPPWPPLFSDEMEIRAMRVQVLIDSCVVVDVSVSEAIREQSVHADKMVAKKTLFSYLIKACCYSNTIKQ